MQVSYEPLRGFKDYVPPESEIISWIAQSFADVAKRFGYKEIRTPTIESFSLFALKSGEEIRESMFVFRDKAGREVALRPEITPSVIRIYLREMRHWPKPIRVYYVGNVFRYDEPQFGRYREFMQAGVEILGADGLYYDVELVELLEEFYNVIGLKDRIYKVNNIAIFRELAKRAGIEGTELDKFLHYLDKGMYSKAIELTTCKGAHEESRAIEELASIQSSMDKLSAMKNILAKLSNAEELLKHVEALEKYFEMVKAIGANVIVEPAFARGIAYYTGIIFEVVVPGLQVSIAGGGRYDDLTCVYGGENLPTTGFAIGVERTMLALINSNKDLLQSSRCIHVLFLLLIDNPQVYAELYQIVKSIRGSSTCVQLEISSPAKLSKWLDYASKYSIDYVIIIGRKEFEKGVATLRDMKKWSQKEVQLRELPRALSLS